MTADKLMDILMNLRNTVLTTVLSIFNVLKTQNADISQLGDNEIAGDWAWDVITKAMETGIINLSDADYDAMYHVFRRCATLEEMIKDAIERPSEVDDQFIDELLNEFKENIEALIRIKERLSVLLDR